MPGSAMAYCLDFQNHWAGTPDALDLAAHFAAQAIEKGPNRTLCALCRGGRHNVEKGPREGESRDRSSAGAQSELRPCLRHTRPRRGLLGPSAGGDPDVQRAILLDPVFTQQYIHFLGSAYLVAGQYETAAAALRERIRLAPKTDLSRAFLASALGHLGEFAEAQRIWPELKEINPKYSFAEHIARLPFQNPADGDRIGEGLVKAGLPN